MAAEGRRIGDVGVAAGDALRLFGEFLWKGSVFDAARELGKLEVAVERLRELFEVWAESEVRKDDRSA
jgi:hypothetical protein